MNEEEFYWTIPGNNEFPNGRKTTFFASSIPSPPAGLWTLDGSFQRPHHTSFLSSRLITFFPMSYQIVAISNEKGAPEQAYNKLERAGACPDANYAGEKVPFPFDFVFHVFFCHC